MTLWSLNEPSLSRGEGFAWGDVPQIVDAAQNQIGRTRVTRLGGDPRAVRREVELRFMRFCRGSSFLSAADQSRDELGPLHKSTRMGTLIRHASPCCVSPTRSLNNLQRSPRNRARLQGQKDADLTGRLDTPDRAGRWTRKSMGKHVPGALSCGAGSRADGDTEDDDGRCRPGRRCPAPDRCAGHYLPFARQATADQAQPAFRISGKWPPVNREAVIRPEPRSRRRHPPSHASLPRPCGAGG